MDFVFAFEKARIKIMSHIRLPLRLKCSCSGELKIK